MSGNVPRLKTYWDWLSLFLCGICMGIADIVPGISGGTVAFIMGIYDNLLASINSFNASAFKMICRFRFKDFLLTVAWQYLIALLAGIALSFILLAKIFDYILGHEVYRVFLYAGFIGLILASIIFLKKQIAAWNLANGAALCVGAFIAYILTCAEGANFNEEALYDVYLPKHNYEWKREVPIQNYDSDFNLLTSAPASTVAAMHAKKIIASNTLLFSHQDFRIGTFKEFIKPVSSPLVDFKIVICGAVAISAMLLPGISGSYLLTVLGVYPVIIGALADFVSGMQKLKFDPDAFLILSSMLIGIIMGGLLFSHVVSWLLKQYRDATLALLTGFMIGAMRSVWPFWSYAYNLNPLKLEKGPQLLVVEPILPDLSSGLFLTAILFAVFGFITVFILEYISQPKEAPAICQP